ncbi:MAG: hypothetical protein QXX38_03235 [Candidatus Aenigmatarchaeota archaeon]
MGLAIETIKDMFNFVFKYPKSFLFGFIITILIFLGVLTMVGGVLVYLGSNFRSVIQSSSFLGISTFFLMNVPRTIGAVFLIIGLIIIFIAGLIRSGGFPILVYRGLRRRDLDIVSVFQITLKKLFKIFITTLIFGIIILLPILPVFIFVFAIHGLNFFETQFIVIPIFVIIFIVIAVFLGIKFWFIFPILMLENKNPMESLKLSWQRTKGYVLSILAVLILYAVIVGLPLGILDMFFKRTGNIYLIWSLIEGIITTTLSGILPTIYYLKKK